MACTRDRVIDFLKSKNIEVKVGLNKARGHKGFFRAVGKSYRIDIARGLSDDEELKVLLHEFVHYLHYKFDNKMLNLDFILPNINDEEREELLVLTVDSIEKDSIRPLFNKKNDVKSEIASLSNLLKSCYPDFQISKPYKPLLNMIKKTKYKYLLNYDRVKILENFKFKIYTIDDTDKYDLSKNEILYLQLKSKQRYLNRINNKINRLNKYYNNPSELLARSIVSFVFDKEKFTLIAPALYIRYSNILNDNNIPDLTEILKIII